MLPNVFCWTRFGTEAGEDISKIIARKELERRSTGGIFFWGIGNAVGPSMRVLIARRYAPVAVFSPISSAARAQDVSPRQVYQWRSGIGLDGSVFEIPKKCLVTSGGPDSGSLRRRYALVCSSDSPLSLSGVETFNLGALRNLVSDRKVGASQVTAVVRKSNLQGGPLYRAALIVPLAAPYLVELADPVPLGRPDGRKSIAA
ncbi:MAG: hypothetical protein J0I19_16160 [Alphaproteobacteria bacterium]|nr:hypothetical protein [Alphaproteobacteria bacterium]